MSNILLAWLGNADIAASKNDGTKGAGPIANAIDARQFDHLVLLSCHPADIAKTYKSWLGCRNVIDVSVKTEALSSPTHYEEIYRAASRTVAWTVEHFGKKARLTFHLSPGTPAMTAIWIILAKTRFAAELIESSKEAGVQTASVPFDMAAEFIPDAVRSTAVELERAAQGLRPEAPAFGDIIHRSKAVNEVIRVAEQAAAYDAPVLVQGETGTGKELLARAIHKASSRGAKPLVAVNCAAIPKELFESEFFGHTKGAFSGATGDHPGYFEQANGGTLFLDEIGELLPEHQVKLLRVLHGKRARRIGANAEVHVDVRIIAATNRELLQEVVRGQFREDLFYRLAVLTLRMPALREREGDVGLLLDHFLALLNRTAAEHAQVQKKCSAGARNLLIRHTWPGNVRELEMTIQRAFILSSGPTIERADAERALLIRPGAGGSNVLDRPIGEGFSLDKLLGEISRHYVARALKEAEQNKTKAAQLIGFKSYQRLTDWMKKYDVG